MKEIRELITEFYLENIKPLIKDRTNRDKYAVYIFEKIYLACRNDEGLEIEIYDGEKLASNQIKNWDDSELPVWFRELGNHFGQMVRIANGNPEKLIGASYTFEDFYYITETKDNKKHFTTCVANIEYLD